MKILYLLSNYPQCSESYIEAEIAFVRSQGVQVEIWSDVEGYGEYIPGVPVHRGLVQSAVAQAKPDLVHVHYLVTAYSLLPRIPGVPATVRAHSFDWSPSYSVQVASFQSVRAIYAFPHLAKQYDHPKIVPLPVAYDGSLYDRPFDKPKVKHRVIRLAAGRRMKGLEFFLHVASQLRSEVAEFQMAVSTVKGDEGYVHKLAESSHQAGVSISKNISRLQAVEMFRTAGIYLETSDPTGHPFGMPVSAAEAMASGLVLIMPDVSGAWEYTGEAAFYYRSAEEAKILVKMALHLPAIDRADLQELSLMQAKKYRSDVVLPRLVEDWKRISGKS